MVLAGKDPMYCLSGKLRFVSQIIIVRRPIFEGSFYFQFGDFFNGAQVGSTSFFSYVPISHKLFSDRLLLTSSFHLRKVCYHFFHSIFIC